MVPPFEVVVMPVPKRKFSSSAEICPYLGLAGNAPGNRTRYDKRWPLLLTCAVTPPTTLPAATSAHVAVAGTMEKPARRSWSQAAVRSVGPLYPCSASMVTEPVVPWLGKHVAVGICSPALLVEPHDAAPDMSEDTKL